MKKVLSLFLAISVALTSVTPCWAQAAAQAGQGMKAVRAEADCSAEGREAGSRYSTGSAFTIGLVSGFALGPIGTGVAWFAQGAPQPSRETMQSLETAECREAFRETYALSGKQKKRQAALVGGLLGTALLVAVAANAVSHMSPI